MKFIVTTTIEVQHVVHADGEAEAIEYGWKAAQLYPPTHEPISVTAAPAEDEPPN